MNINKSFCYSLILIVLLSCSDNKNFIYYSYNGDTITRIDTGTGSFFYLGKFAVSDSLPQSYVKASYPGRDGTMSCYLIFRENGRVDILDIDGVFDTINTSNRMRLTEFQHNLDFIKWNESIEGMYGHRILLFDFPKMEIENNAKNQSKVMAIYPEGWAE